MTDVVAFKAHEPAGAAGTVAIVFAGGVSLASVQVGMLRALMESGIRPDLVVGTSSGALNAALYAARPDDGTIETMAALWRSLARREIFPLRPAPLALGLVGRRDHAITSDGVRSALTAVLPIDRLEEARIPLHVVACDLVSGAPVVLSAGPAVDALMACCAIPGVYPSVSIDGRDLVDGGVAEDPPVMTAVALGATVCYVLPVGWPVRPHRPRGVVGRAMSALDRLSWKVAQAELDAASEWATLYVLPAPSTTGLSPFDPRESPRLIDEAYTLASAWLECPAVWRARDRATRG